MSFLAAFFASSAARLASFSACFRRSFSAFSSSLARCFASFSARFASFLPSLEFACARCAASHPWLTTGSPGRTTESLIVSSGCFASAVASVVSCSTSPSRPTTTSRTCSSPPSSAAPPARMPTTQLPESSIPNDLPAALRIVTSTLWQPASNSSHICMQSSSSAMISGRGTHERREHGIHLHRYSFWPSLRRTLARAATWW